MRKAGEEAGMVEEWVKVGEDKYDGKCIGCGEIVRVSLGGKVVGANIKCKKEPGFCLLTQLQIESRIKKL